MTPERPRAGAADPPPPSPRRRRAPRPAGSRPGRAIRARVWTAGRLLLLAGALLATYGLFFLTAVRVTSRAREVRVPDVRGVPLPEARATFEHAGLQLRVDPVRRPDAEIPADHVASQDPEPGTVLRRNRFVRVRLSDGHRAPDVPAVVGLHVLLIASWLLLPALGVIGVIFGLVWIYMLWLRKDLLKRMAEGRLPSQQTP